MDKNYSRIVTTSFMVIIFITAYIGNLGGVAFAQSDRPDIGLHWEMVTDLVAPLTRATAASSIKQLNSIGVKTAINNNKFIITGQGSWDQMQAALFGVDQSLTDFLGGPVDLTIHLPAGGTSITLNLQARNTTGYIWDIISDNNSSLYTQTGKPVFAMRSQGVGVPAIQTIPLKANASGDTAVHLKYWRPFEPETPIKTTLNIWMTAIGNVNLSDPNFKPHAEFEITDDQVGQEVNPYIALQNEGLPSSWDWRTQGIIPPVRNQGACGSCWAFGTVGAMEPAIMKAGGSATDLSEQFLVSCNTDGWGCDGGSTAHNYHYDTLGINQTTIGAVLESEKPYTATNGTCTIAYNHPYKLSGWDYVSGSWPTVDQLKNAIYNYGPIKASVCADDSWSSYISHFEITQGCVPPRLAVPG